MSERALTSKIPKPDEAVLRRTLGRAYTLWEAIVDFLKEEIGPVQWEWKYYSTGWLLKTLLKKRNLFFLIPLENAFKLAFILGDKAVAAVEKSDLPPALIRELRAARKYAEGRGLKVEVSDLPKVEIVKKMVKIKLGR